MSRNEGGVGPARLGGRALRLANQRAVEIQASAVLVGHDWGATHTWNASLLRPDRFEAVFCLSVPYVPRGETSVFEKMRKSGHQG
jgi:pimeloyl-ACP methyl ester carboxylesterase